MEQDFKIYVEQLKEFEKKPFYAIFSPDFLEVEEAELFFPSPVTVSGEFYRTQDELILHWDISTVVGLICSICTEKILQEFNLKKIYQAESLQNIKSGVFSFKNFLRETILLEVPQFGECNNGHCPKRKDFAKYLKNTHHNSFEDRYRPFENLEL